MYSLGELSDSDLIEEFIEFDKLMNKQTVITEFQLKLLETFHREMQIRAGRSGMGSAL